MAQGGCGGRFPVSGFVLAGGKSTRMGTDKALLELSGRTLLDHALGKLRTLCLEVAILSNDVTLGTFARVVRDVHPHCGPLSGIEAALLDAASDWSLILPVDVPFVSAEFLGRWIEETLSEPSARLAYFVVDARPQPALALIHRALVPALSLALEQGRYKLLPELQAAAAGAVAGNPEEAERAVRRTVWHTSADPESPESLLFANLNTPQEFVLAERHAGMLDKMAS